MRLILMLAFLVAASSTCQVRADDCASSASQTDMNLCEDAALKRADAELNKTYQEILERLKDSQETKQLLVASQRLWVRFRDAECAFTASGVEGGSIYPTILLNCRSTITENRVKELGVYLKCEEGDLACPVPAK